MSEFNVDLSSLIVQLNNSKKALVDFGKTIDKTHMDFQSMSGAISNSAKQLTNDLNAARSVDLDSLTESVRGAARTLAELGDAAKFKVVASFVDAGLKTDALTDSNHKLHSMLYQTEAFKLQSKHLLEMGTAGQKAVLELDKLTTAHQKIQDPTVAAARQQKILNKAHEEASDQMVKMEAEIVKATAAFDAYSSEKAKEARDIQHMTQLLKLEEDERNKLEISIAKQRIALEQLDSVEGKMLQLNQRKVAVGQEENKVQQQLHVQLAREKALRDPVNQALSQELRIKKEQRELQNVELDMARKLNLSKKEQQVLAQQIASGDMQGKVALESKNKQSMEELRLQERLNYVKSDAYRTSVRLQQAIKAEETAVARSTQEMRNKTKQMRVANQVAAGMRATFAGLKTSFGMFTSSTIAIATAMYAVTRSIRSTIEVGSEFGAAMSRTAAIMGGVALEPAMFDTLEAKVRSLAQTTQYTANETAAALTELGQAGLSPGEAMQALAPTLDLAAIGQISMARAADHATNIMMIFGKEAKDLTDIVDVMATAVSNSNTNVDQLANALTYAGPAAEAAGFSFRDTVAVTETLASAGFKASRAGTGMRRLFVSLVNPTSKGKKVLDQLGLSVTDLEGNVRDLTEILYDMDAAMSGMAGPEKLTAIQNLVGVYATSPVSALMGNIENLKKMEMQLEYTGGAADKMRLKIEDALKFDARMALSAFQEAQLSVFDKVGVRLQVLTMEVTNYLNSLTQPIADGTAVTKLDQYIHRLQNAGTLMTGLAASVFGFKGKTWIAQAANDLSGDHGLIKSLRDSAEGWRYSAWQLKAHSAAMAANTAQTRAAALSYSTASAGLGALSAATNAAAWAMNGLSLAMKVVAPLVAVAGVAYSAYQALSILFGPNVEEKIERQKTRVDELTAQYRELKEAAAEAAAAAAIESGAESRKKLEVLQKEIENEIKTLKAQIAYAESQGLSAGILQAKLYQQEQNLLHVVETRTGLQGDQARLEAQRLKTAEHYSYTLGQRQRIEEEITNEQKNQARIEAELEKSVLRRPALQAELEESKRRELELDNQRLIITNKLMEIDQTRNDEKVKAGKLSARLAEAQEKEAARFRDKTAVQLSDLEQYNQASQRKLEIEEKLLRAQKEIAELEEQERRGLLSVPGAERLEELEKASTSYIEQLKNANDVVAEFGQKHRDSLQEAEAAWESMRFESLSSEEQFEELSGQLKEVADDMFVASEIARIYGGNLQDTAEGAQLWAEGMKKYLALVQQLRQLAGKEERGGRGPRRPEKSPEEQRLEEAIKLSESLRKEYDKLGHASDELKKKQSDLEFALSKGAITQEAYAKGMAHLHKQHAEMVIATDKNRESAKKLLDTYLSNSLNKAAEDLAELNRLHKEGAISAEQHALAVERLMDKQKVSGPEVGIQLSPNATFLQEAMAAAMDYSKGMADWQKIGSQHGTDTVSAYVLNEREREEALNHAQQTIQDQQDLREALLKINEDYDQRAAAQQQIAADTTKRITEQTFQYQKAQSMLVASAMLSSLSDMVGQFGAVGEEASSSQKAAFLASKAFAVAQILLMTEVAAMQAMADPSNPTVFGKIPLATVIRAQGYASAGMAAAMAIGEYSGAYDKGGYIPTGKWGIVGEYGPEIVNGPAHVTGREETARKLGGGGDSVTIAPVINVNYTSEEGSETSADDARTMANTIRSVVLETLQDQMRPNGMLAG